MILKDVKCKGKLDKKDGKNDNKNNNAECDSDSYDI